MRIPVETVAAIKKKKICNISITCVCSVGQQKKESIFFSTLSVRAGMQRMLLLTVPKTKQHGKTLKQLITTVTRSEWTLAISYLEKF